MTFYVTKEKIYSKTVQSYSLDVTITLSAENISTDFLNDTKKLLESRGYKVELKKATELNSEANLTQINDPQNPNGVSVGITYTANFEGTESLIRDAIQISNDELDIEIEKNNIDGTISDNITKDTKKRVIIDND
ncbi:hypothetical protein [Algibacter sp. 2305UL17-15]|uniref:hypothetical protein n=1 Tax=Algibacter sp. 2305UL17-15 TaxID=3231268 RepID=UPI003459C635